MGPHIRSFLSQYDSIEEGYNEEYEHSYYPISSPDVPIASACSIPSFGSRASPAMMEFSGSLSLQTPPQYLSAMATPPAFRKPAYPPSPFSDSTPHMSPYMSENNESPFGVPMFHPPLAQYEPVPWSWWNPPQHRSSSFHSSSSLSFSSSQGDSSASSCSSYHPGDQLSVRSTPTSSFHNFEESALASPSENLEGSNAPGIHSEGDVNSSNRHCGQLVDANNPPMNSLVHFNEKHEPYAVIIYRALMSVPEKRMVLADIYDYFRQTQSARAGRDSGWKNSIRHNLSMNGVGF